MIRLEKHDEIVEATAREACQRDGFVWEAISSTLQRDYIRNAAAALDAMLEAVVRLEVGNHEPNHQELHYNGNVNFYYTYFPALILKLEPKPSKEVDWGPRVGKEEI